MFKTCVKYTSLWFRDMGYVKTIIEAFRWHIHKIVNESTKHQLETTFYTGINLWKPYKARRRWWEEIALQVTVYVQKRKSCLTFSSGLSHTRKENESNSAIRKHLWGITIQTYSIWWTQWRIQTSAKGLLILISAMVTAAIFQSVDIISLTWKI